MNKDLAFGMHEVMESIPHLPSVSIIMPFEPKMGLKRELTHSLKLAADQVKRELEECYPNEIADQVVDKLRAIIKGLHFNTHKKSIAIYVSPVFEKVLYLDIPVEEKITVDESFEIRDLVDSKKRLREYLVLLLSGKEYRMYLGNSNTFVKIVSHRPESVYASINEIPERVANYSDLSKRKEIIMDKFLRHIDNSLHIILNAYHLPLFVLGTQRIGGHFKKLTRHSTAIIGYVHGNYEETSIEQLKEILAPHIADWQKVTQIYLLNQLEEAAGKKMLAAGISDVWREAINQNGRVLILERNYGLSTDHENIEGVFHKPSKPNNRFSSIKGAVDEVIEKVLESGGDVEFVDKDFLENYQHIALVQYHS